MIVFLDIAPSARSLIFFEESDAEKCSYHVNIFFVSEMYIFLQIAPKRAQRGNYLKSHSLLIKTSQTQSTRSFLPHTQYMKNECWQLCMTRCMTSFVFFIAIFVKIRLNTRFPNFLTILEEKSASSAENVSIYSPSFLWIP